MAIKAAIVNVSKALMMPAQHHLHYLTLTHHHATKLATK